MTASDAYRILVAHDLEPTGDEALSGAVSLARRVEHAEIHVIHVIARPAALGTDKDDAQLEEAMVELRARASLVLPETAASITAHLHVRFGDVLETLQQVAVDYDASILVVGTHGRSGLERVGHRSVAEHLARTAHLPVLVAHAKDFTGLTASVRPDPASSGKPTDQAQTISEVWIPSGHAAHIAGLV